MSVMFVDLVEELKQLSIEEKIEAKQLLDKYVIEERREEILRHYHESREEAAAGNLRFTTDPNELESLMDD